MIHEMINDVLGKTLNLKITRPSPFPLKEQVFPLNTQIITRLLYFYEHLRSIQAIEGSIVECGVGWGRSLLYFSMCQSALPTKRMIYGFDSFDGFPEPTTEDNPEKKG